MECWVDVRSRVKIQKRIILLDVRETKKIPDGNCGVHLRHRGVDVRCRKFVEILASL